MRCLMAILLALAAATKAPSANVTASEAGRRGGSHDASTTLWQVHRNHARWSELLHKVASGRKEWLEIANQLYRQSDAGATEELALAVGEALESNPSNVLRLSLPVFRMAPCEGPDIDDARYDSFDLSDAAIRRREDALLKVVEPELHPVRQKCIAALEASRDDIARFYASSMNNVSIARSVLVQAHRALKWHAVLKVDLDCDGLLDQIFTARDSQRFFVAVVLAPIRTTSKVSEVAFFLRGNSQDAFCGPPSVIERERLGSDSALKNGETHAVATSATCFGLHLEAGECDAFHLYWNRVHGELDWWRL